MDTGPTSSRKIRFANFRLDYLIGSGGVSRVYKGWDLQSKMPVAIKIVDANFSGGDPEIVTTFFEHTKLLTSWQHKNIIRIHRAGYDEDYLYLVMEHVDGMHLRDVIEHYAEEGELIPHDDVIQVVRSVALALDYAHRRNVLHLDIKPQNILLDRSGRVVLTDFNIPLKIKKDSGIIFGSAHYMSPEQVAGKKQLTPRSDLYALGICLFEMLTGTVPFDDPDLLRVAMQQINLEPPSPRKLNPNINPATEAVLLKALSKNPEDRFATGEDMITALEEVLAFQLTTPAEIRPLPPPPAGVRMQMRRLSQKAIIERVITRMEVTAQIKESDHLTRQTLERAINRLENWRA